jgi:hypothetical protein
MADIETCRAAIGHRPPSRYGRVRSDFDNDQTDPVASRAWIPPTILPSTPRSHRLKLETLAEGLAAQPSTIARAFQDHAPAAPRLERPAPASVLLPGTEPLRTL